MSEPSRAARDAVDRVLAGADPLLREELHLRLERWWDDLHAALQQVYPADADALATQLVGARRRLPRAQTTSCACSTRIACCGRAGSSSLGMLGYATYADRFAGDLAGVGNRICYLRDLGVTYLHLMPLLLPREGDNDGGYAVADYRTVRPDLGTMDDLAALTRDLRAHGISLVLDLVLNHVAREHAWARAARAGDARTAAYFHVFDRPHRAGRLRAHPAGGLPRLRAGQLHLRRRPGRLGLDDVQRLAVGPQLGQPRGARGVRRARAAPGQPGRGGVPARRHRVPVEAPGHHLPEPARGARHHPGPAGGGPDRLPCSRFQGRGHRGPRRPARLPRQGSHHGKVSDLAYHNSLMVQVWSMLATRTHGLTVAALRSLPRLPPQHRLDHLRALPRRHRLGHRRRRRGSRSASRLPAHRRFLADFYAGTFPGSTARGLVFQANPATGDRRISGTTASLAGLASAGAQGPRGASTPAVRTAVRRVLLAHAVVIGFGGIPVIWRGDELAQPDDPGWADEPGHASDNRWTHRPRLDWQAADRRRPRDRPGPGLRGVAHLARVRASLPHLHASIGQRGARPGRPGGARAAAPSPGRGHGGALQRRARPARFGGWRLAELGLAAAHDVIGGVVVRPDEHDDLWLEPYQALWLVESAAAQPG